MARGALKRPSGDTGVAVYRPPAAAERSAAGLFGTGFGMQRIRRWVINRKLSEFAAVLVDEGAGWLDTESGGRQRIEAPALFWLLPGERHSYGPDEATAWHERWVLFAGPLAERFVATRLIDPARLVTALAGPATLAALFGRLHSDFLDDGPLADAAIAADLHRLVVTAAQISRRGEMPAVPSRLDEAVAALREAAAEPIEFAAFARRFGFSPATFRRQMQLAYGLPPKVFQREVRLARAKELLAVSGLSIEAVARAVGFDDPYYFSRVFVAQEGVPPSEFRRRNQRG